MANLMGVITGSRDRELENFYTHFIQNDTNPKVFGILNPNDFSVSVSKQILANFKPSSVDELTKKVYVFVMQEGPTLRQFFSENSHRIAQFTSNLEKIMDNPDISRKIIAHVTPPRDDDRNAIDPLDQSAQEEFNQQSAKIIQLLQGVQDTHVDMQASHDMGGHGGTYKLTIYDGQTPYHLFLKPLDKIEYQNYILLQQLLLSKFLIPTYGTIKINGEHYLVMKNARKNENGEEVIQLADIKLAGIPLDAPQSFNPICSQNEMQHTRGVLKAILDFMQMNAGVRSSPGFLIAKGARAERILHYSASKENLQKMLSPLETSSLQDLKKDLKDLKLAMESSPVALISGSIILIKDNEGHIKPMLIDPAHIQLDPSHADRFDSTYYSGNEDDYSLQRRSNQLGLNALINAVQECIDNQELLSVDLDTFKMIECEHASDVQENLDFVII